jgi:hypothetical protein
MQAMTASVIEEFAWDENKEEYVHENPFTYIQLAY